MGGNFLNVICINELAIGLDHSPLTLLLNGEPNRRRRNFRFEEMLMESPEYKGVIKKAWIERNLRESHRSVEQKLRNCRKIPIR